MTECSPSTRFCFTGDCESGWFDVNLSMEDGCEARAGGPTTSGPEVCNGWDDDGDGLIDEPGPQPDGIDGSADPENPAESLGGPCGSDVGTCKLGTATCVSGEVKCVGSVGVAPELCDGLDNDCNGHVDDPETVKCGSGFCGGSDPPQCLDLCADDGTCPNGLGCASIHVSGGATTETRRGCAFFRD